MTTAPERVLAIGDIGVVDGLIHIGDEAMFEALRTELRSRGIEELVAISANPADSAERYGVESIDRIGFAGSRDGMTERMARVLRAAEGDRAALSADDPALIVIDAVRQTDAVIIAGGGNLASTWPLHIFERATLGRLAHRFGKPLVVTGQTIGPTLTPDDAELIRELLSSARLVGLRERASHALCARLGVPAELLTATIDDASFVEGEATPSPYCAVTLSTHLGPASLDSFATRIAELLESLEPEPVFLPHFGALDRARSAGDSRIHDAVIARLGRGRSIAPTSVRDAARFARSASVVVTSRYHPAVFAASAAVPTLGIPVDAYTEVKLRGALGNFGQDGILPVEKLLEGDGRRRVAEVWAGRHDIRGAREATIAKNRQRSSAWWDRVVAALGSV